MATKRHQRKRTREETEENAPQKNKQEGEAIDTELSHINDLLQNEETSQKQTWQIGKRLKKLMESYPEMHKEKAIDAYFLWGTALARLASQNEDPVLAEAAADKFQQMHQLSEGDDSFIGPVGYSLWASSLLTVATGMQQREILDQALLKFEQAVEVDGGTTFETRFQHAKALKEGGDLVKFLESNEDNDNDNHHGKEIVATNSHREYYRKALRICAELEKIYEAETAKATVKDITAKASDDAESESDASDVDEDDDKVLLEDFAEVKLLEAILHAALEDEESDSASLQQTLALFEKALEISQDSSEALMEKTSYLSRKCIQAGVALKDVNWEKHFDELEVQYTRLLAETGFDINECHQICVRKDTQDQEEPEEEEIDERVPHLLNCLGKGLSAYVRARSMMKKHASSSSVTSTSKSKKKDSQQNGKKKQQSDPRFVRAVEVLRSAHHFHDKLGCYELACLYAAPEFADEENCKIWLETADSYGVLVEDFNEADFRSMQSKPWFQKFTQPEEEIDVNGEEGEEEDH